ncbi:hypothetical protein AGMMS4952_17980 [Spirochaetia bacterium]|nr:hypothetical protein AGMMS4952_17980 [Spirochaetia bacterium]
MLKMSAQKDDRTVPAAVLPERAVLLAACALLTLLASCPNPVESAPHMLFPLTPGMGRVQVRLNSGQLSSAEARTLMPSSPTFTKYTLDFTKDGQTIRKELPRDGDVSDLNGTGYGVELESGTWDLTVTAYTGTSPNYREAAVGAASVVVTAGTTTTLPPIQIAPIPIDGNPSTPGTLKWVITLPALDAADGAGLYYIKTGETSPNFADLNPTGSAVSAGTVVTGSADLPPGYYDVTVLLTKSGSPMGRAEVAHIYSGLTTTAAFTFPDGESGGGGSVNMKWLAGDVNIDDRSGLTVGTTTVKAYSDYTCTTPIITDPATVTVNGGTWRMKIPEGVTRVFFKLEHSFSVNSKTGVYSEVYGNPNPTDYTIPPSGRGDIHFTMTIPPLVAYRAAEGGKLYSTLQAAINDSTGTGVNLDPILLIRDITIDGTVETSITVNRNHVKLIAEDMGSGSERTISFGSWHNISVTNGGSLELEGTYPLIIKGEASAISSAIVVGSSSSPPSTLTMRNGVKLQQFTKTAVKVQSGGIFNMAGGAITGNVNEDQLTGGGVLVDDGVFTMSGGEISDNHCTDTGNSAGGGVYVKSGGSFAMSGGRITGNSATTHYGGGVYVTEGSSFTMTGGSITDNHAPNGGGVRVNGSTFAMSGGDISENGASDTYGNGNGGGVYLYNSSFTMSGAAEIAENTANVSGGGVYVEEHSVFTMTGGSITGNEANGTGPYDGGGGVYMGGSVGSNFIMTGGSITGNIAATSGGGVYMSSGSFTMTGGSITGNEATGTGASDGGGGVYVIGTAAVFTMNGGIIGGTGSDANTAMNGGGVYMGSGSFSMAGGSAITGNTAATSGGGVYMGSGIFTMYGGTIGGTGGTGDNVASNNGASLYQAGGTAQYGGSFGNNGIIAYPITQPFTNHELPYDDPVGGDKDPAP